MAASEQRLIRDQEIWTEVTSRFSPVPYHQRGRVPADSVIDGLLRKYGFNEPYSWTQLAQTMGRR